MKKEILKTDNYLLVVDDSEIKVGDWLIVNDEDVMQMRSDYDNDMSNEDIWVGDSLNGYATYKDNCKKVIAHLPINDSADLKGVPLLPPLAEGVFVLPTKFEFEIVPKKEGTIMLIPPCKHCVKPKTTTNSQGQQVACGKYIY